ncbi:MAG: DUF3316 domain-containing protein [Duncaniella sp.]|nr:DUF3316 domain-containing protein [Duncaniella sp.]
MKRLTLFVLCAVAALAAWAQGETRETPLRPVLASYTLSVGSARVTDTYLTPLTYTGWHTGVGYTRMQASRWAPERWTAMLDTRLWVEKVENPPRTAAMWSAGIRAEWGMVRRWALPCGLTLAAGPALGIDAGAVYNARNGNNPVGARAAVTANLTGFASYALHIRRLPVTFIYRPSLPVIGTFFSPEYGELYYEIYLGNRRGLMHPAWWGSRFGLDNTLTADINLGTTSVRIGYEGRILSTKTNHIVTRNISHCLTIGVSGLWLPLSGRRTHARTINPCR